MLLRSPEDHRDFRYLAEDSDRLIVVYTEKSRISFSPFSVLLCHRLLNRKQEATLREF